MSLEEVFIVSAARTPIGSFNGVFAKTPASDLGAIVIKEVCKRGNVKPEELDEVILGQILIAGCGQNPARQAAIKAGVPQEIPSYGVNMLCGSGLKSVALGYQSIRTGDSNIVLCGGQENMTQTPHLVLNLRQGIKLGPTTMQDSLLYDGLTDAMHNIHMGVTAENLAKMYNISREEQDEYAARSQNLVEIAQKNGYFDKEIVPVEIPDRKGPIVVNKDEFPKPGTTVESLSKLKPCFIKDGSVTPGNASGINDAASAVLLMSGAEVKRRSAKPIAKVAGWSQVGVDPKIMGIGPVTAVQNLLKKVGWNKDDVDLYELNEAFAAQTLSVNKCLQLNMDKVNVNGGAIALGHPIGASGNRILVSLLYTLQRTGGKKGIASLCVGGGMGIALAVEMV